MFLADPSRETAIEISHRQTSRYVKTYLRLIFLCHLIFFRDDSFSSRMKYSLLDEDQMIIPNQIVEDAAILSGIMEINRSVKIHLNNERCVCMSV